MIRHISIRNFAIIEHVEIDFSDGLSIITGETGAGKSIVIEAVSLALGSRADTAFVRSGCEKATVQMIADDADGTEYIITREVSSSGRNVCRINDEIVTLSRLSSLCRRIADIHGQYDHQSLLDPSSHIRLLDSYESRSITPAKDAVALMYADYAALKQQLEALLERAAKDARQKDFMAFELQELTEAKLIEGEDEQLEQDIALLQNSEQIYENLAGAYELLSESDYAALSAVRQALDRVSDTGSYSDSLQELAQRLSSVYYELEDICGELRGQRDRTVFSPELLDRQIARLDQLSRLKQKHAKTIAELIDYRQELSQRLEDIEDISEKKRVLEDELKKSEIALRGACNRLTDARKAAAASLQEKIAGELSQLNFSDCRFSIDFRSSETYSEEGTDIVEFLISTNRGEPEKPLSKIASGGEMSRIMLAFKKIIGEYDRIPSMIFDEIDAGISGVTASIVGRKMLEISSNRQIICITHLPQIAACADRHYRIEKSSDESMTYTSVTQLNEEERTAEIARLLGGVNVTETTMKSARELIEASRA